MDEFVERKRAIEDASSFNERCLGCVDDPVRNRRQARGKHLSHEFEDDIDQSYRHLLLDALFSRNLEDQRDNHKVQPGNVH